IRDGLQKGEHLFKLRGAELTDGNLIVAQRLRTEWELGRALPETIRQGRWPKTSSHTIFSLADLGVSPDQSSRFQRLAEWEREDLEAAMRADADAEELSTAWALKTL